MTIAGGYPNVRGVQREADQHGVPVFRIGDPNALTQMLGWAKYKFSDGRVYFRGQASIYPDMLPTGLRSGRRNEVQELSEALRSYIDYLVGSPCACTGFTKNYRNSHRCAERMPSMSGRKRIVPTTYRAAIEPLLQHYGIATRWIDVVDNIWVALWFAAHTQVNEDQFAHHARRSPAQERSTHYRKQAKVSQSDGNSAASGPSPDDWEPFAYVAVLQTGPIGATTIPGYSVGQETRVVDLRACVPSTYLRPHAQHGILMAPFNLDATSPGSLAHNLVAYFEIRLEDALDWLGEGAMLSPFVLFPPATMDDGYRWLTSADAAPKILGHITHFGPGR